MKGSMRYFAYGSNLFSPRLRFRVPGCRVAGVARLPQYQLRFHKRGSDGSAKCDAFRTGRAEDFVIGVVYEIPPSEKKLLDRFEGLGRGYDDASVTLLTAEGTVVTASTYVASPAAIDATLRPFGWYKDFVLRGAAEHALPDDYVAAFIRAARDVTDPDPAHEILRRAELAFASAAT